MERYLALAQGIYYLLTGLWPLVSITTFQAITGPKTDLWLVKTVGVIVAAIGTGLLTAYLAEEVTAGLAITGGASAGGLMMIDIIYVMKGVISRVYLLDGLIELILAVGWIFTLWL